MPQMKRLLALALFSFAAACAIPPRIVRTATDEMLAIDDVAADLVQADVVALGELHGVRDIHRTHMQLIEEMHRQRSDIVIAMEMFERDVQEKLLQYLAGLVDEGEFLAKARQWGGYATDYRPVIEYARAHGLVVIAANAPRELAAQANTHGVTAVLGNPYVARETTAPEDEYWDAFVDAMQGHGGTDGVGKMQRYYAAQCLKDDTMAESVTDYLRKYPDSQPLVVLICGKMHSDYGRGTVQRIKNRMPALDVRVVSSELVEDMADSEYTSLRGIGDYVIVARQSAASAPPKVGPLKAGPLKAGIKKTAAAPEPVEHDPEARPALGIMPDYAGEEAGVLVGGVREGGPAEKAGLRAGDLIVEMGGLPVEDIEGYVDALGTCKVGDTVVVRVKRDGELRQFEVTLTSRTR